LNNKGRIRAIQTREQLVSEAQRLGVSTVRLACEENCLHLLQTREEILQQARDCSGYTAQDGVLRLLKLLRTFDDCYWALDNWRKRHGPSRMKLLIHCEHLCTSFDEVQKLYPLWPPHGKGKRVLIEKACKFAQNKKELSGFILNKVLPDSTFK